MLPDVGRVSITGVAASLLVCSGCAPFANADVATDGGTGTSAAAVDGSSSGSPTSTTTADTAEGTGASTSSSADPSTSTTAPSTDTSAGSTSTGEASVGPYPIVLAHGFFGFEDFAGAGFVDYFWNVREDLAEIGETDVFTPPVDPFNDSTLRGMQLLAAVEAILEETGAEKVNIIGHSQGGLDARVVAHLRPDLVASVTTVSTPHGGTPIADYALLIPGGGVIDVLVQLFGGPLWGEINGSTSLIASMEQFSEGGIAAFNETYTDASGVAYASVAGRSDNELALKECASKDTPPFLANWDGVVDPIDPLFADSEAIVDGGLLSSIPNDGLVRVDDAKWGTFLGCIPADHIDQIGHLFGDGSGGGNAFDHLAFHRNLVGYLRARGF